MIPASPGVEMDFKSEYGGSTLKEALINAGAPIAGSDTLRYDSKSIALAVDGNKATIRYIQTLVADFYSRPPVQRDGEEVSRQLIGKTAELSDVDFPSDMKLGTIRFEADHVAVGFDAKGGRSADLRWAVSSKGDIFIRHSDGRLLLNGNLNAPGSLVFTLAKQTKAYDIALQPR
ncbi:hypothetical protein OKA05_12125 [Luteolibacter arcticus]|uniref:DUF2092 domain-containing protein n=1 Tax=Luteolibacter arcticus TaxID=1581411 RepID=A0ABT3GIE7_9BACT|nr:hypothetical protein [Luteolibacter arcticus]MCW1923303.1 hypothetical protein [Luteolibacter arcticus]